MRERRTLIKPPDFFDHVIESATARQTVVPNTPKPGRRCPRVRERLAALGLWCGGFLSAFGSGLGLAADGGDDSGGFALPGELQEIVDDLAAIAEVEPESARDEDSDDDDDPESQFVELEEFVRVAVLLIMSELARGDTDQDY